jgi:V-type H+-transporting ATPase subunit H
LENFSNSSFEKYVKELESGDIKQGSLHTSSFWEDNYKEFEHNNFEYIKMLVRILQNPNNLTDRDIEMKCIACFDLGEFVRLYPGGASVLEYFGAKDSLLFLIQHNNLELKNRALVCLQKIMMRSLKK